MNALVSLLALVAAGLAALVVFELQPSPTEPALVPTVVSTSVAGPSTVPSLVPSAAAVAASNETLLRRPLFSQTRRPPNVASPAGVAAVAAEPLPRMTGILIDGPNRRAIFAGASGGKATVVVEGGHVGAFTVQTIDPRQVTLVGPGGPRTLRTAFDPALPAPAAVPSVSFVPPQFPGIQPPGGAPGGRIPGSNLLSPGVPPSPFSNQPSMPGFDPGTGPGAAR
jgi:general secretion pathway protein N